MDCSKLGLSVRLEHAALGGTGKYQVGFRYQPVHAALSYSKALNGSAAQSIAGLEPVASSKSEQLLQIPEHVAIIMDGNSRWARRRGLPVIQGHEAGVESLKKIIQLSSRWGVKVLTVFAFSTENWLRPKAETELLMKLFEKALAQELLSIVKEEICLRFIGDLSKLPGALRALALQVQERTSKNKGLKLVVALSYSGRQDITQACKALAADVKRGVLRLEEIDEERIGEKLLTSSDGDSGEPDLLIRTSGEERLSNFLLWQLAYTELVFVDELWPDFGEAQFRGALRTYQKRDRRFGKR